MEEKRKKKKFLNQEYAMMRYNEGATDQEIAEETGVSKYTVALFRKRHLLPANSKKEQKPKTERKLSPLARDNAEARKHGMNYGEYMGKTCWRTAARTRRK